MKLLHGVMFSGSVLLFISGVVILHVLLNRSDPSSPIYLFDSIVSFRFAMDLAFLNLGCSLLLAYILYFIKSHDQIVTFTDQNQHPIRLNLKHHQLTEAILIIRPVTRKRKLKFHIVEKKIIPLTDSSNTIIESLNADDLLSFQVQDHESK